MTLGTIATPLDFVLCTSFALTAGMAANGIVNLFFFRRPKAPVACDTALPRISVLIPARNEELKIERCVRSLLRQNYPHFEVVVLDDSSNDATYDILCRLRDQDDRLRVLAGAALPDDWCGKPYAAWQLAGAAQGDWLLMTDADCEFSPDALLMAVGAAAEHRADVVSLAPEYVCIGFWEKLVVPLLVLIPIAFLPLPLVRGSRAPLFAAANGAFLFLSRATYFEIDGHRAVRAEIAEDVKFARHVKLRGKSLWYGDGSRAYRVRMYESLPEIWTGFTRNLFPAFSADLSILAASLLVVILAFVAPPVFAFSGWLIGAQWTGLALAPYVIIVALRIAISVVLDRDDPVYALLNPLAWSMAVAIAIGSVVKHRTTGAEWKNRRVAVPRSPRPKGHPH